jgi:hypothetical protein
MRWFRSDLETEYTIINGNKVPLWTALGPIETLDAPVAIKAPSGYIGYMLEAILATTTIFSVDQTGSVDAAGSYYAWENQSIYTVNNTHVLTAYNDRTGGVPLLYTFWEHPSTSAVSLDVGDGYYINSIRLNICNNPNIGGAAGVFQVWGGVSSFTNLFSVDTSGVVSIPTGASVGYVWTCTDATTGAGSWQAAGGSATWSSLTDPSTSAFVAGSATTGGMGITFGTTAAPPTTSGLFVLKYTDTNLNSNNPILALQRSDNSNIFNVRANGSIHQNMSNSSDYNVVVETYDKFTMWTVTNQYNQFFYYDGAAEGNIGIGYCVFGSGTHGYTNVCIGAEMMSGYYGAVTGQRNTGVGWGCMGDVTSGNNNTMMGLDVGQFIQTGSFNTFLGAQAVSNSSSNTTMDHCTVIGYNADALPDNSSYCLNISNFIFGSGLNYTYNTIATGAMMGLGVLPANLAYTWHVAGTLGLTSVAAVVGTQLVNSPVFDTIGAYWDLGGTDSVPYGFRVYSVMDNNSPVTAHLSFNLNNNGSISELAQLTQAGNFVLGTDPTVVQALTIGGSANSVSIFGTDYPTRFQTHQQGSATVVDIGLGRHSDTAGVSGNLYILRSRGTEAIKTAVQNGDDLGTIYGFGYDGSTYQQGFAIDLLVNGTVSAGNPIPTTANFYTGSNIVMALNPASVTFNVLIGDLLGLPSAPAAVGSNTGGSLGVGTYYFVITAIDAQGTVGETLPSGEVYGAVTSGTAGSVAVSWTGITGAAGYRVYVGTSAGGETGYISTALTSLIYTGQSLTTHAVPMANNGYMWKQGLDGSSYDFGSSTIGGAINSFIAQTTLNGATAGTVVWSMPFQGSSYKRFIAYFSGYENDTASNDTITFSTAFSITPLVTAAVPGLTVTASTSTLTIISPDSTVTYSGWVIVEGY